MSSDQNGTFLRQIVSQLLPQVFSHPVWLDLTKNIANYSPDFIQHLLHNLQLEEIKDDLVANCEVSFICAYLQSYQGEHAMALFGIEQVWKLAETERIGSIARCAAWGAFVISVRQNNYLAAIEWLSRLQEKLKEKHEWVLIDVLELFKQQIESREIQDNGELLDWLVQWGESPHPETTSLSQKGYQAQRIDSPSAGIISRLINRWNLLKDYILYTKSSGHLPRQPFPNRGAANGNKIQERQFVAEPKVSQFREESSSAPVLFPESIQSPTEVSRVSIPLLEANVDSGSVLLNSTSKQLGLTSLAIYCLGQFQVYQDEQLVENWLSRKALSVFKYLILEHPTPVVKEVLMDTFWPDSHVEAARRNLHQAIYALRQILRGEQNEFHHIFFKNDCYSLNPDVELWIDVIEFEKSIRAGRRLDQMGQLEKAIEQDGIAEGLYQGDLLEEDLYEDWPVLRREQLCNSYLNLVERLTELYFQTGQYTSVIHLCHKVLDKDRCYEAAHRMLMQCYLAQGQRHLAVRQYQTCVRALREDLGIQASRETIELYHRIAFKRGV